MSVHSRVHSCISYKVGTKQVIVGIKFAIFITTEKIKDVNAVAALSEKISEIREHFDVFAEAISFLERYRTVNAYKLITKGRLVYRTLKLYIKLKSFNLPHLDAVFASHDKKRLGIYRLTMYSWTLDPTLTL